MFPDPREKEKGEAAQSGGVGGRETQVERLGISNRSWKRGSRGEWRKLGNVCFCKELKKKKAKPNQTNSGVMGFC